MLNLVCACYVPSRGSLNLFCNELPLSSQKFRKQEHQREGGRGDVGVYR
jgi:hypothetical protein